MRVSFDSHKLLASVWIGIAAEAARRAWLYETHSQRLPADESLEGHEASQSEGQTSSRRPHPILTVSR